MPLSDTGANGRDGFFDHGCARTESVWEKADYIMQNPIRAGLAQKESEWPFVLRLE